MIKGSCLCGNIEFLCDFKASPINIYQCHCSLCKKQTGSSSNSATFIAIDRFTWINQEGIKVWQKPSGFSSHFCQNCGCGVPNVFANRYYWVPMGLLDAPGEARVVAHLCLNDKASWHTINAEAAQFQALPELAQLLALLEQSD